MEIGGGDGGKSLILGLKSARVLGIDISPRAIDIANKRAVLHGVADRVKFICTLWNSMPSHFLPVLDSVLVV